MSSTEPDQNVTPGLGAALAEPAAVCEHFYASHCYRGMSVRLCMLCHEPDWDDLAGQMKAERADERARIRSLLPYNINCCEGFPAAVADMIGEHGDA